ncbi:MAG: hypothetical protein ACLTQN_01905 [Blautia massiliensis (ex Durand et al. 2017)]
MNKTVSDRGTKGNFARLFSRSVHQSFFIAVSLFFCMGMLVFHWHVSAKEQETVKVILFSHNFQEGTDDNSSKSGYSYEYLQKLASYTGWKYEYVLRENGRISFEQLQKDGEPD